MTIIKNNLSANISLKQAIAWCSLVGIDEVIQDIPHNYFVPVPVKTKKSDKISANPSPSASPDPLKESDLSFDGCQTLEKLEEKCSETPEYNTLSKTASYMLFGKGSEKAKIMVIAEKPGREEDLSSTLFSSKNGQLICSIMGFSGLNEDDIYYTYLSKWRPPGGRKLNDLEKENLSILLKKQINIINPQTIVTFGETALHALLPKTEFNFRKNAGKLHPVDKSAFGTKTTLLALFHEETLLKTPQLKKATWLSIVNCKGDLIRE